jgi:hypothetical protein
MITAMVSLFLGASFVTSVSLVAACILSGKTQEAAERELALEPAWDSCQAWRSIAEVELPRYSQRRQAAPAHAAA